MNYTVNGAWEGWKGETLVEIEDELWQKKQQSVDA